MKAIFLAAALMISGAAIAQDTTPPATPDANTPMGSMGTTSPTSPTTPDAATPPADMSATPPTTATDPGMSAPSSSMPAASTAGAPSTENYPVCSRTVTDRCVQKGAAMKMHKKR